MPAHRGGASAEGVRRFSVTFERPPDLRFSCTGCGDCCRGWDVPLAAGEAARLEALDWAGREAGLEGGARVVRLRRASAGVTHRLERGPDGACAYLAADAACLIHRHFGEEAKPLACRLYPFSFRAVGDRVAVDAALSCRAIALGHGAPLSEREEEWSALLAGLGPLPEADHRLTRKVRLDGRVLLEIEGDLLTLLADRQLDFLQRVRCALDFARLATTGDPSTAAARTLRRALVEALPAQVRARPAEDELDRTQRAVFFQWLYLAVNPPRSGADALSPSEAAREQRRRVRDGNLYRAVARRPWVDGRELSASFEDVAAVGATALRTDADGQLERFFRAKVVGQRFLLAGEREMPFAEAVPKLLLWYPLAIWTAKALAADRRADEAGPEDVRTALRLLDRSLGQLSTASLPRPQAKACDFVMLETDVVVAAALELLGRSEASS
jgi:lysine-N-methylase